MPSQNSAFMDSDASDPEIDSFVRVQPVQQLPQAQPNTQFPQQPLNPSQHQEPFSLYGAYQLPNSAFQLPPQGHDGFQNQRRQQMPPSFSPVSLGQQPDGSYQLPPASFTPLQGFHNQQPQQMPSQPLPSNFTPSSASTNGNQQFALQNPSSVNGANQQQQMPPNYIPSSASLHGYPQQHQLPSFPFQGQQPLQNPQQQMPPTINMPMGQNPNNFMQDPNFMQYMTMFMQQMQLAQQNGTIPSFQSGQNVAGNGYQNTAAPPSSPFQQQQPGNSIPPLQQQQPSQPTKSKASKIKNGASNAAPPPPPSNAPTRSANAKSYSGPREEVYILVLGETGVGKSTWINGIANYMSFDVITEALDAPEPVCVIPSKFTMCDDDYQQREIVIGDSTNEVFDKGQSATQDARTYLFQTAKYDVYIIDTPGIGDVRGIEQDKENTRKILNAIAPYKNLHAICLLFKSNDARMTLSFRYCISELLLQLHRDAAKNIVFFFTNSRGTFYKPGDTIVPLREFLKQLQEKHGIAVSLDKHNIFCLDNEAFKFVCAYHDGVEFSEEDMLNFASSWKRSADETHRFLDYAAGCKPHSVDKTLSVNQARGIILQLAKPLADINDLIETNIKVYNDRKTEIENTAATIDDLNKKLLIPQVGMKTESLPYPMTVCTGEKCIETQSISNSEQRQTVYKQICHDHCQLDNVDPERFPEPHLQQCWAMQGGQNCRECGCAWSVHMHIRFKQVKTSESVEDENIKNAIQTNEDARITKQKIIESCEKMVDEYKHEQKIIMDASIRFAVFLKQNAIMAYNDVFEKYVEKSIEEEEKCIKAGGDHSKLDNLKRCLDEYRQERAAIEHAIQSGGNNAQQISTDDVKHMKSQLFSLPHFGAKLKELFERTVQGYAMNQQQSVQKFAKPTFDSSYSGSKKSRKPPKNHNVMTKLRNVFGGRP